MQSIAYDANSRLKRQLKTFLFQQSAWLTLHQRLCSLGFYGALEICILLLLLCVEWDAKPYKLNSA